MEKFRKEIINLIEKGVTVELFEDIYNKFYLKYCDYTPAYSKKCGELHEEHSIAVMSVTYKNTEYHLCENHSSKKCYKCGKPAVSECSYAGQFVCGVQECPDHSHYEAHSIKR